MLWTGVFFASAAISNLVDVSVQMFLQADENFTRTSLEVQGVQRGVARRGAPFEISIMIYTSTLHV